MESIGWQELTPGLYRLVAYGSELKFRAIYIRAAGFGCDRPGPPWVLSITSSVRGGVVVAARNEYPTLDEAQLVGVAMYRMGLFNPPQEKE